MIAENKVTPLSPFKTKKTAVPLSHSGFLSSLRDLYKRKEEIIN